LLLLYSRLHLLLTVCLQLLLLRRPALRLLAARTDLPLLLYSRLHLLLTVCLQLLLLCGPALRLFAVGADLLLLFYSRLHLLLTVYLQLLLLRGPALRLLALSADLLLRRGGVLPNLVGAHLGARGALRSLDGRRGRLLALHARSRVRLRLPLLHRGSPLPATALPSGLRLILGIVVLVTRSGSRRSRDRQSGDACGKKQPSHDLISFERAKTVRWPRRSRSLDD
ncbi:MAG TPA: hypothetical protein VLM36_12060, partial [Sphingomicrobium sp.]|nr:hypothetical protein [Sphingomicrobium sp.]